MKTVELKFMNPEYIEPEEDAPTGDDNSQDK